MKVFGKTLLFVLVASLIVTACGSASTTQSQIVTPPECADNPNDLGICIQRTVLVDDVGQVFRLQSFEPPAPETLGALMSLNVQQMAPGAFPWSKWDWSEYFVSNLDPTSFAAWGNPAEPCESTGMNYTQELAYNSVTWTGVATGEEQVTSLDGTYIHFDVAVLTSVSMNHSLAEGSCYTDLHIRADLVK